MSYEKNEIQNVIDDAEVVLYRIKTSVESSLDDLTFAIQNLNSAEGCARLKVAGAKIDKIKAIETVIDTIEGIVKDKEING